MAACGSSIVVGIKFLPVVTALVAAAAAVVVSLRSQRRSGDGQEAR